MLLRISLALLAVCISHVFAGALSWSGGLGLLGDAIGIGGDWGGKRVDYYSPLKYEFDYGVLDGNSGDRKRQTEIRRGDVVKGEYSLEDPDGTVKIVKYEADDKNGFNAKVIRKGPAIHPDGWGRKW